ncbi:MAG TPA: hypothetical protein VFB55_00355 [Verrucomicrobiae bacterium]|nr:hypothetical protein [Verrucomicrobiae bacterium]
MIQRATLVPATLLAIAAIPSSAWSQDVLAPSTSVPTEPAAVQERQNANPMQVFPPTANAPATEIQTEPFQWGPVILRPHLDYQFLYGNGINASPGQQEDTVVQRLAPGVLFDLGPHWTLDYTPTLNFYSNRRFRDTVDHHVALGWGTAYGNDWFFSAAQNVSLTSDPNVATAAQTDQQNYSTAFNASYLINTKLSLDLGLNQDFNYIGQAQSSTNQLQNLTDSRVWSTMDWLNYQFWTRLNAGIGIGGGYVNLAAGSDQTFEQYQARVNWRATDKISFQLSGGLQDQQYLSSSAGDLLTPIFTVLVQYQPFDQTRLSLSASRTVSTSYFQNQTTENTSLAGDLNQRLLGRLYLDLSGGYTHTKYVSSATVGQIGFGTGRSEDSYFFGARLTCPFLKRGTAAVFYQYSDNSSAQSGFVSVYQVGSVSSASAYSYSSHQVGFEISWRY